MPKHWSYYFHQSLMKFHIMILLEVALLLCWASFVRGFSLEPRNCCIQTRKFLSNNLRPHSELIINSVSEKVSTSMVDVQTSIGKEPFQQDYPRHIAFICDGNSRWARIRNLPKIFGHSHGANNLVSLITYINKKYASCTRYITFYGFSTENWSRSVDEINGIWNVIEKMAREFRGVAIKEGIYVRILGHWKDSRIPQSLQDTLEILENDTAIAGEQSTSNLTVCIAINYGGRADILNAALKLANSISNGEIIFEDVADNTTFKGGNKNDFLPKKTRLQADKHLKTKLSAEEIFDQYLCTDGIPDPDLLIRTGGQQRLSNFLLWNIAYSEIFFSQDFWPDFKERQLDEAIEWFQGNQRRFGGR